MFEGLELITALVLSEYGKEDEATVRAGVREAFRSLVGTGPSMSPVSLSEPNSGAKSGTKSGTKSEPGAESVAPSAAEARAERGSEAGNKTSHESDKPASGDNGPDTVARPVAVPKQTSKDLGKAADAAISKLVSSESSEQSSSAQSGSAQSGGFEESAAHRSSSPAPSPAGLVENASSDRGSDRSSDRGSGPAKSSSRASGQSSPRPPVVEPRLFSFVELFPDAERESARKVELFLGIGDPHGAILACDSLLSRVLASAAAVGGSEEAPRDPSVVSNLIGCDGRAYLGLRRLVRAARQREQLTLKDAFECYVFVLDARRRRDDARRMR